MAIQKKHREEDESDVDEEVIDYKCDVDDFTNYSKFRTALYITFWSTVDSIIWSLLSIFVLLAFSVAGLFHPIVQFTIINFRKLTGNKVSAVSQTFPRIHQQYAKKLRRDNYWETIVKKLTEPKSKQTRGFDYDLAQFHIQLAALAYESEPIVDKILKKWPEALGIEHKRFGDEGCRILAVWSVKHKFVELVFKGTSPYNLTEWLTDCTVRKRSANNSVLPGLIHTGFYNAFGFPNSEVKKNKSSKCVWNSYLSELKKIIEEPFPDVKPNLWITGHSLGAATATVFTSMLLWRQSDLGKHSTIRNLDLDKFNLCGTYTYGTPRVGDFDWKKSIENIGEEYEFYRVINANDIVCSLPPSTSGTFFNGTTSFLRQKANKEESFLYQKENKEEKSDSGVTLNDFCHLGTPIFLPYRIGERQQKERNIWMFLNTLSYELALTPAELCDDHSCSTIIVKLLAIVNLFTFGTAGLLRDHIPSEYIHNLAKTEEHIKKLQNLEKAQKQTNGYSN